MADHGTHQRAAGSRLAVVVSHHGPLAQACASDLATQDPSLDVVVLGAGSPTPDAVVADALADLLAARGPAAVAVVVPRLGVPGRSLEPGPDDVALATSVVAAVAPAMVEAGHGRIVLVSEVTSVDGRTWEDGSATAMWGLVGLGRSAARDLAIHGVTVNVVRAGVVATPELEAFRAEDPAVAAAVDGAVAATPLRRLATMEDIAAAVSYLASDDASYVTGLVLPVDGGLAMGHGN